MKETNLFPPEERIMIGTVQLGMPYGIQEKPYVPSQEEVMIYLDTLWAAGLRWLDTAEGYGCAESLIGQWHSSRNGNTFHVCSKISMLDHTSRQNLYRSAVEHVTRCCERLQIARLDALLWHNAEEFLSDLENSIWVMKELQKRGYIVKWGVSAYAFNDFDPMIECGMNMIQIPFNALDSRLLDRGIIKALSDSGTQIYARSIFLQGLLTRTVIMPDNRMVFARDALKVFQRVCRKHGKSQGQMAIDYVMSFPEITGVVIGCRNNRQLGEVMRWMNDSRKLEKSDIDEMNLMFREIDPRVITPTMW